jgi:hypothetical protein
MAKATKEMVILVSTDGSRGVDFKFGDYAHVIMAFDPLDYA